MFQTNHVGSTTQSEAEVATAGWPLLVFRLIGITEGVGETPDRHYLSQRWGAYQINLSGENPLARSKGWCIDNTVLRQIIEKVTTEVVTEMLEISILFAIKLSIMLSLRTQPTTTTSWMLSPNFNSVHSQQATLLSNRSCWLVVWADKDIQPIFMCISQV